MQHRITSLENASHSSASSNEVNVEASAMHSEEDAGDRFNLWDCQSPPHFLSLEDDNHGSRDDNSEARATFKRQHPPSLSFGTEKKDSKCKEDPLFLVSVRGLLDFPALEDEDKGPS